MLGRAGGGELFPFTPPPLLFLLQGTLKMALDSEQIGGCTLYFGDCLEVLPQLDIQADMVLVDPPYGTTNCKWDSVIPLPEMWACLKKVAKLNAVVAITASQPFTSALVISNPSMFKHEWVWIKNRGSNFANTVREPMKEHESVVIFSTKNWIYNKQMQERTGGGLDRAKYKVEHNDQQRDGTRNFEGRKAHNIDDLRVPSSWQKFNIASGTEKTKHPTQKPVALIEYLIKTYTNEGDTVLDFTMGSGTTGVACVNTGRKFIGIELDAGYFDIACDRIEAALNALS